jgi:hypothetical protein
MEFKTFENEIILEIFYINLDIILFKNIKIFKKVIKIFVRIFLWIFFPKQSSKQRNVVGVIPFAPMKKMQ